MADKNNPADLPQYSTVNEAVAASKKFIANSGLPDGEPKITLRDYFDVGVAFVFQEGENHEKRTTNAYLIQRANQELLRTFWRLRDESSSIKHTELFQKPTCPDSGESEEFGDDHENEPEEFEVADDGGAEEQDKRRRERASIQKSVDETYHSPKGDSDTEMAQDANETQRNREDTPKAAGEGGHVTPPDTGKPDPKSKTSRLSRSRAKGRPASLEENSEDDVKQPKSRRGKKNSKSQRKKQHKGDDSMPPPPPPEPLQTPLQSIQESVRGHEWLPADLSKSLADGLAKVCETPREHVPRSLRLSVMGGRGDVYELINNICKDMDDRQEWNFIQMGNRQPVTNRAKAKALITLGTIFGADGILNLKKLIAHARLEATIQAVIGGHANSDAGQKAWAAEDNIDFDQDFDQKAMLQLKTELGSDEDPLQVPIRIAAKYLEVTSQTAHPVFQEALFAGKLSRSIDAAVKKIKEHEPFRTYCFKLVHRSPTRGYSDRDLALDAIAAAQLARDSSQQQVALTTEAVSSDQVMLSDRSSLDYKNYNAKIQQIIKDLTYNGERLNQLSNIFGEGCLPLWLSPDWITRTREISMPIVQAIWENMKKQCPELMVGLVTLERNVLLPMFTFHDPRGPVTIAVESKDEDTWNDSTWLELIYATDGSQSRGPGSEYKAVSWAVLPGATSIDPEILAAVNSTPLPYAQKGSVVTLDASGTPLVYRDLENKAISVDNTLSATTPNLAQTADEIMEDDDRGAYEED